MNGKCVQVTAKLAAFYTHDHRYEKNWSLSLTETSAYRRKIGHDDQISRTL